MMCDRNVVDEEIGGVTQCEIMCSSKELLCYAVRCQQFPLDDGSLTHPYNFFLCIASLFQSGKTSCTVSSAFAVIHD